MVIQQCNSSVIDSTAYSEDERILYVMFNSGKFYKYSNVPLQTYIDFVGSASKGKFFNTYIKNQFPTALPTTAAAN